MTLPASAFPLSVSGARILGADGQPASLGLGVNWGGGHQDELLPYGLDKLPRADLIARIAGWGMSHVRLTFALGTFMNNNGTLKTGLAKASRLSANPDLIGMTPWEVYCQLADDMTAAELYVMLNKQLSYQGWCCSNSDSNGLWYNDNWPSSTFSDTWFMIADRFAGNPRIGLDLHNEPRPAVIGGSTVTPTWGDGIWASDFRRMYQWHADQLRARGFTGLIFCEGLGYATDLRNVGGHPVTGPGIVYSVHDYPWYHKNGNGSQQSRTAYYNANDSNWGYLLTQDRAPVWVGECGSNTDANTAEFTSGWFPNFMSYCQARPVAGACVPLSTEILTRTGWKKHDELRPGTDETLGYRNGRLSWCKVTDVQVLKGQPVIRFGTRQHWQAEATPDHQWLCQERYGRARIWGDPAFAPTTRAWQRGPRRIILSAPADGGPSTCSPDEAALVAWLLGDGTVRWKNRCPAAVVYQKNYPDEVRDLLIRLTALVSERSQENGVLVFRVRASVVRKIWDAYGVQENLLGFVLALSEEARAAWLHAWHRAEGDRSKKWLTIYQNPGVKADAIALSVFLSGSRPTVSKKDAWRDVLSITAGSATVSPEKSRVYDRQPDADVWCPSTELRSWVARDSAGRIFLTGNCWWELGSTGVLGTEPSTNVVKSRPGGREGFGLAAGQDWLGSQTDTLARLAPLR